MSPAAAAAHFANPRNDFWRLLHDAGFTPRLYDPQEQFVAARARLRRHERGVPDDTRLGRPAPRRLRRGRVRATHRAVPAACGRVRRQGGLPRAVRRAARARAAAARSIGQTGLFVLPSTSPANAAVPYEERLRWFRGLREWLEPTAARGRARARARRATTACCSCSIANPVTRRDVVGDARAAASSRARPTRWRCARELREEIGLARVRARPARSASTSGRSRGRSGSTGQREQHLPRARRRARARADDRSRGGGRRRPPLVDARRARADSPEQFAPPDLLERVRTI